VRCIFIFLILHSCQNINEPNSTRFSVDSLEKKISISPTTNLGRNQVFLRLIEQLKERSIGISCKGNKIEDGLEIYDFFQVHSTDSSYGKFNKFEKGHSFCVYLLKVNECSLSANINGLVVKNPSWWSVIQSAEGDCMIVDFFTSDVIILKNYNNSIVNQIIGNLEQEDFNKSQSEIEKNRIKILQQIEN
jgi:hypothetical protein